MPPAIERVEQAHGLFLIVRRAAFHNRADQHLQQPAPNRIDHHRNQKPRISAGQNFRQHGKSQQTGRRKNMRKHDRGPVSDPVHKSRRQKIDQKLDSKVEGDQYGNPSERNPICTLKSQEQKRNEIIDNRLYDVSHKTRIDRFLIFDIHSQHSLKCIIYTLQFITNFPQKINDILRISAIHYSLSPIFVRKWTTSCASAQYIIVCHQFL
jgi:hypothetical protein